MIKRPEAILDESLSILIGYLLRLPQSAATKDEGNLSVSSDNPMDAMSHPVSAYHIIDLDMVLKIDDPGSIIVFVDRDRIGFVRMLNRTFYKGRRHFIPDLCGQYSIQVRSRKG